MSDDDAHRRMATPPIVQLQFGRGLNNVLEGDVGSGELGEAWGLEIGRNAGTRLDGVGLHIEGFRDQVFWRTSPKTPNTRRSHGSGSQQMGCGQHSHKPGGQPAKGLMGRRNNP